MPQSGLRLSPSQQQARDQLSKALQIGSILRLWGGVGRGKTTVLTELRNELDAAFLDMSGFVSAATEKHPLALEETLHRYVRDALQKHEVVIVDDIHLLDLYHAGCHFYPRAGYFNSVMMGLCDQALANHRKLIFGTTRDLAEAAAERSYGIGIERFKVEDYAALVETWLGPEASRQLDFHKIFRFAPKLNGHQLKAACHWLQHEGAPGTDRFIEYLRSQRLASNVDLGEVQAVDLRDLKGVDDVLRSLEINIVLPLENDAIATEFQLRSKRGVLLYGPPGSGKTTIGRALAHRLRSKFFLIDGTFIAGTDNFYQRIKQVFEAAKDNAPAVIFIDDADAIFEDGEERGLYRYLLTMLDGLESESAGRVCVMMTAMNVAHLPPALIRSGRIELWLGMKLPDADARASILSQQLKALPEELRRLDLAPVVKATDGFTGADLKRTIEDGKALYAYEKSKGTPLQPPLEYFLRAVTTVSDNKRQYAEAEAQAALRPKSPFGGVFGHMLAPTNED